MKYPMVSHDQRWPIIIIIIIIIVIIIVIIVIIIFIIIIIIIIVVIFIIIITVFNVEIFYSLWTFEKLTRVLYWFSIA